MSKALSVDLRQRVVAAVSAEGLSHRAAAARFKVTASISRWRALERHSGHLRPGPLVATGAVPRSKRMRTDPADIRGAAGYV